MTMQQVMDMMQSLQEAMAASKVEQERMQVDLAAHRRGMKSYVVRMRSCVASCATTQGYVKQMIVNISHHRGSSPHRSHSRSWMR